MKLILLRHAKSAWNDPLLDDHARPLNERGQTTAPLIGAWLAARGHVPDMTLCSTALRAQETEALLGLDTPAQTRQGLYHASADILLQFAQEQAGTLMIVGHNPGMGEAAHLFCAPGTTPVIRSFPTCACAVFAFTEAPAWGTGRLVDFATPRTLGA